MTAHVNYLRKRGGVFQYERRVPQPVQRNVLRYRALFGSRPLFRRSLRTKDAAQMMAAYMEADAQFESLLAKALNKHDAASVRPSTERKAITQLDLESITDRYREIYAEPFEKLHRLADCNLGAAEELAHMEYQLELDAESIRDTIFSRNPSHDGVVISPIHAARSIIADRHLAVDEGSQDFGALVGAIRAGMIQGYQRINALNAGEIAPALPSVRYKKPVLTSLSIREAVEKFIGDRELPIKTKQEVILSLKQFEGVIGNKNLSTITKDDFVNFVDYLSNQKVGDKTKGSIERYLSAASIVKRVRGLKNAINYAKDRNLFCGVNPADDIKVSSFAKRVDKSVMPNKRRFTIAELNKVFAHPWFVGCKTENNTHVGGDHRLTGSEYWVPVVALYTGCRASELAGLKLSEVHIDGPMPHIVIQDNEHRATKGGYRRSVPILDALLDLGFRDYVKRIVSSGAERLFPDWQAYLRRGSGVLDRPAWSNSDLIRSFNRSVIPATLGRGLEENARRAVTFHAFRGAFKAMLTVNDVQQLIVQEVVGHAKTGLDQRYIGELTIEETYRHVKGCDYSGLLIPKLEF